MEPIYKNGLTMRQLWILTCNNSLIKNFITKSQLNMLYINVENMNHIKTVTFRFSLQS